ncbi:MAG: hypothetical protein ACJAVK_003655 [Akkermansiaceae bacterium]|jgi:hypothetical protein
MKQFIILLPLITLLQGQISVDSDSDDLDDAWELTYFPSLETTTGSGNADGDSLDNLAEQTAGTNPTNPDTDNDGLPDHVETSSGIYVSATDTGTDPLTPDSDADGLLDGEEVAPAAGSATNPNDEDSDNDQFLDRIELERGSDPNNATNTPTGLRPLTINEIVVSNETGLKDGNDRRSDWIEIYNPNPSALNLAGFHLTDDPADLTKWTFPSVSIRARAYLIVFASGDNMTDPEGNPHTHFRLSASGEYLALVSPSPSQIEDMIRPSYPEQFTDISYGRPSGGGGRRFFALPTPDAANTGAGSPGVVKDTNFSFDRGFYDTPFDLEITSTTREAIIRYTRDGSLPTLTNGTTYSGPLTISTTTNIRALAFLGSRNFLPTNVDTHTYIFPDDVGAQNATEMIAKGWAPNWGYDSQVRRVIPADYDMDPRVVNDDLNLRSPGYSLRDALLDVPSVSLTLRQEDFVQTREGTSTFPRSLYGTPRERDFEPACSIEYLLPNGDRGFQEDCKVETHGNSSRTPSRMQKHSLRLTFSTATGTSKLRYNLFPDSPVDEFNKLVLRACFTDSWALASWAPNRYRPNDSLYTRDVWMKELFNKMGQPSSYGNFVHLYVNGAYFGIHNLTERVEDDFYADHQGGDKDDWEVNADLATPGPLWNAMMATLNSGVTSLAAYNVAKTKIDVANYADWVILHLFADSEDWPLKNSYAAANAISGDGRYRFNVWDQEIAFDKYSWNRYDDNREGMKPFQRLRQNEDFQMLFADRIYKHLHDDGALTAANSAHTLLNINRQIDKAIVAESARWGDVQATTPYGNTPQSSTSIENDAYPPLRNNPVYFTREQHWLVEQENIVTNYLPTLHDPEDSRSFIREVRSRNLYPDIDPPLFSQLGGVVPNNFSLQLTTPVGAVYYTTDGSDPRLDGGLTNPSASSFGGLIGSEIIDLNDFGWTYLAGSTALSASNVVVGNGSYDAGDWKHPAFDDLTWAPDVPEGAQGPFEGRVPGAVSGIETANTLLDIGPFGNAYPTIYLRKTFESVDSSKVVDLNFRVIRDDAMIVYLNGREIYRDPFPGGIVTYSDFGPSDSESEPTEFRYPLNPGDLLEGENVLAVELHNESSGSSDLGLQLAMSARKEGPGGNTLNLTQTAVVKSRVLLDGEWSALREAAFIVGTPAAAGNLVISEIMYNQQGADENLEFIEILNINPELTIDLTKVSFTDGILYAFPSGFTLPALSRVVIAKDRDTFISSYGTNGFLLAPGNFESSLSNNGETLTLSANNTSIIHSFDYHDEAANGWPVAADGFGPSLVLINPLSNPNHGLGANWMASVVSGGTPGRPDVPYPNDPESDDDGDDLNNLAEYFFGTNPALANGNPLSILAEEGGLTLTFSHNPFLEGLTWEIEASNDLEAWESLDSSDQAPAATATGLLQESVTIETIAAQNFYRIRVITTP